MVVVGNGSLTQNNCQHFMLGFSWKATNVTCMFLADSFKNRCTV